MPFRKRYRLLRAFGTFGLVVFLVGLLLFEAADSDWAKAVGALLLIVSFILQAGMTAIAAIRYLVLLSVSASAAPVRSPSGARLIRHRTGRLLSLNPQRGSN